MSAKAKRVQLRCPECNAVIGSAPEDDLPTGDLVCPTCDAVVKGPTQVDKLIGEARHAIKEIIEPSENKRDPDA